ncbi:MAG: hypothetical protein E6R03_05035 [Hyphomicrobiaceae bacterium]|nr:MAG: hypothetical protein E6R03_05035 [Hyphomicrobiaceae bacterium]
MSENPEKTLADELTAGLGGAKKKAGRPRKDGGTAHRNQKTLIFNDAELADLVELAEVLGCSQQDVIRRALAKLKEFVDAEAGNLPLVLQMSGDPDTVARKQKAIEAFRVCGNVAVAADRAGVTTRTIQNWAQNDPVFAELSLEGKAFAVGKVQCKMYKDAIKGNTSAQFGILNAHDPNFGAIRTQMLQRVIGPLLDGVVESARRYLPVTELQRFALECGRLGERVALQATASKR